MKPARKIKTMWATWGLKDGTPVRDLVADILKLLEEHGDSLTVDGYFDIDLKYERLENDTEYNNRINYEAREIDREKNLLKILLDKYGLPTEDLKNG
jgi:hypothetical protein